MILSSIKNIYIKKDQQLKKHIIYTEVVLTLFTLKCLNKLDTIPINKFLKIYFNLFWSLLIKTFNF